jgi:hypothetical protein
MKFCNKKGPQTPILSLGPGEIWGKNSSVRSVEFWEVMAQNRATSTGMHLTGANVVSTPVDDVLVSLACISSRGFVHGYAD